MIVCAWEVLAKKVDGLWDNIVEHEKPFSRGELFQPTSSSRQFDDFFWFRAARVPNKVEQL